MSVQLNLPDNRTEEVLDDLFRIPLSQLVEKPVSPDENAIIQIHILIYGKQGDGKTTLIKSLVSKIQEYYGKENTNASIVAGDLELLLDYGIVDVPINILCCEDMTLRKVKEETLNRFFKIRHEMRQKTGRQTGMIITIVSVHRFHSVVKELRTDVDLLLFRRVPTSPYDKSIVKKYLKQEKEVFTNALGASFVKATENPDAVYQQLLEFQRKRKKDPSFLGWTAFVLEDKSGFMHFSKPSPESYSINEISKATAIEAPITGSVTPVLYPCANCKKRFNERLISVCRKCKIWLCPSCVPKHWCENDEELQNLDEDIEDD